MTLSPSHGFPPFLGAGLLQSLARIKTPIPHLVGLTVQGISIQGPQPPSTREDKFLLVSV